MDAETLDAMYGFADVPKSMQDTDSRFIYEPFLEESELGDAEGLQQRLSALEPEERRRLVNSVDQHGNAALLLKARRGDMDMVQVLLENSANPNDYDTSGVTALHHAACRGSSQMIGELLHYKANLDKKDDGGETALFWARSAGALSLLLEHGAETNGLNAKGQSALIVLAMRGDTEAVERLAAAEGADIDLADQQGRTAHMHALQLGHLSTAERLAAHGAAVAPMPVREPLPAKEALFEAAYRNDVQSIADILAAGPELRVDMPGNRGETPLLRACASGSFQAADALLHAGADPCRPCTSLKENSLHKAVLSGTGEELLWLLLEARADPGAIDIAGRTPKQVAVAWKREDMRVLLEAAEMGALVC